MRVFFVVILDARRVLSNSRVYDILSCERARARARRRTFFLNAVSCTVNKLQKIFI